MGWDDAIIGGIISAVVGAGTAVYENNNRPKTPNLAPPPGAAMTDMAGANAAAQMRQRQASAGGLQSTITGAGTQPAPTGATGATAGAKQLLGQ